jgi:hypothetical protein
MHAPVSIKKVMSMQYVCMHPLAIIIKNICQPLFLWSPAPAAASAAVDESALSRLKQTHLMHIFICPRLFTSTWRKKIYKV